jgi:hypothetical protein
MIALQHTIAEITKQRMLSSYISTGTAGVAALIWLQSTLPVSRSSSDFRWSPNAKQSVPQASGIGLSSSALLVERNAEAVECSSLSLAEKLQESGGDGRSL